jgi:hypothetical protein
MAELERDLERLGRELDYPATPDLAAAVAARLPPRAPAHGPRALVPARSLRALAVAALLLLLLAGGVYAASPEVRRAVRDLLGLRGATIERTETLPPAPPVRDPDLGDRVSPAEARGAVAFAVLAPAALGEPDAAYVRRETPGGEVSLAYRARPGLPRAESLDLGLLVTEFRGDLHPDYVGKVAPEATRVERLQAGRHRAIWIEGAPHLFFYRGPDGAMLQGSLRLAENVLLVERGRLLVRLEGRFGRERALALAASLR